MTFSRCRASSTSTGEPLFRPFERPSTDAGRPFLLRSPMALIVDSQEMKESAANGRRLLDASHCWSPRRVSTKRLMRSPNSRCPQSKRQPPMPHSTSDGLMAGLGRLSLKCADAEAIAAARWRISLPTCVVGARISAGPAAVFDVGILRKKRDPYGVSYRR